MSAVRRWQAASLQAKPAHRAALARVIGTADVYALAPFAVLSTETGSKIAMCLSPPPVFDSEALLRWDNDPDSDIVLIDPATGKTSLADDPGGWICGPDIIRAELSLFTCGLRYARAWAANRASYLQRHRDRRAPGVLPVDPVDACSPGLIVGGDLARVVSWSPLLRASHVIVDNPSIVRTVEAALLRAARVPTVAAAKPRIARAA
jgi:hypothetical protein